jgi:hypothetical protein
MEIAYCADFSELQQSTLPENCVKLSNLGLSHVPGFNQAGLCRLTCKKGLKL